MFGHHAPHVAAVVAALAATAAAASSATVHAAPSTGFVRPLALLANANLTVRASMHAPVQDDAEEAALYVVGLADKGLDDLVIREGRAFLEQHGSHARATLVRYLVGDALFERADWKGARPLFDAVVGVDGFERRREARFRLGQCALELDDAAAAIAALEALVADDPDYLVAPGTFLLGEARFAAGDHDGAERAYWTVMQLDEPGDYAFDAACAMCWTAQARGASEQVVERASACIEAASADEPRLPELWLLLGETRYARGEHAEALAAFARVADGEQRAAAERGAAFALVALGRDAEAAARFETLAARGDEFANAARVRATACRVRAADFARALELVDGLPRGARSAESHYWRGRALAGLARHDDAVAALKDADRANPSAELRTSISSAMADALYALGRTVEAARVYEASGGGAYALHAAAVARANAGDFDAAIRSARRLLTEHPTSEYATATRFVLGEALFQTDDFAGARAAFAAVDARSGARPEDVLRAGSRLAWCAFRTGDFAAAESGFEALARSAAADSTDELTREALFMAARSAEERGARLEGSAARDARARARQRYARFVETARASDERPEALLRLARLTEGEAGEARLEQLATEYPKHELADDALLERAERIAARGDVAAARVAWRQLLEAAPNGANAHHAHLSAAWCANQLGEHDAARAELVALLRQRGVDAATIVDAHELLAWVESARGDGRAAEAAVRALAERGADEARVLAAARRALAALTAAGEAGRGAALMDDVARVSDGATARAARVESVFARLDAAALETDTARRARLVDAAEQIVRALATAMAEGRATEASAAGSGANDDGASALEASVAEAAFFVGESRYASGNDARALALYDLAATGGGVVRERALYKGGFAALRAEDWSGVAARFTAFAAEFDGSVLLGEVLFLLGEARYRLGDDAGAIEALARMRTRFAQHELADRARFRLGLAHSRAGQHADAARVLAELVRRAPDFEARAEAELWRGRSLAALGDRRAARAAFAAVLERDKGRLSARARLELGELALAANDLDDALSEFLKVAVLYEACDEVADALVRAGSVLERQGEVDAALARYREVLADHADTPHAAAATARIDALTKND